MKRFSILLAAAVAGVLFVATFGADYQRGGDGSAAKVYFVVSSEASGAFKRGGPSTWICDGTDDHVQIQAAVDAAAADNAVGAKVKLVGGRFYLGVPTGTTVYTGTCETATDGVETQLDTITFSGTFTIADVTAGDIIRIWHDEVGTDPADNYDDVMYTVTAKAATPDTINLHGLLSQNYDGGDTVNFTYVPFAITMASGVTLEGDTHDSTRLVLADSEDVSAVLVAGNFCKLQNFDVRAETPGSETSYNRLRNGIVVADDSNECNIESVSVWNVGGDGYTFNHGHGVRMSGDCWVESVYGYGIVGQTLDNELTIQGAMLVGNFKDSILIRSSYDVSITECYGEVIKTSGLNLINLINCYSSVISNNRLGSRTAADIVSLIRLDVCEGISITGNTFRDLAGNPCINLAGANVFGNTITGNTFRLGHASSIGVTLGGAWYNTIVGNAFYDEVGGADAIDNTSSSGLSANRVAENSGTLVIDESGYIDDMTNDSGATINNYELVMRNTTGYDRIAVATSAGVNRLIGILDKQVLADAAVGAVTTHGRIRYAAVDGTNNVADGSPLRIHTTDPGSMELAGAGDTVVGYALEVRTADSVGATRAFVLKATDRYVLSGVHAVTATADGLTTGLLGPFGLGFSATITSGNAAHIVTLPPPVVGCKITLITDATGCELRTVASSNVKINNVDADGDQEAALAGDSHFHAECISSTEWILRGYDNAGGDLVIAVD